ncbi:uncharacterized protein LOC111875288 isoform X1 [Cryptotermes secundus]|uniref:uncharacterized protein LOC111875288 isoform X1 n=1 Tax=Cryptotermes secundus TaxID=105785 RepID=UPI001454D975|nr:uncharacterized protein LOC111875288 isoform X1 [Cryptotermes secundus]XP_033611661.1 uncharacterized protein LOC111875288 isoform X1 [Cryptotermes secundus]
MKPSEHGLPASGAEKKIPRPPNGYIIFGREWRKKLATLYPTEGNTQISVRLGNMWHSLTEEEKQKYLDLGRHTALEHRLRYPDYTYNPNEARIRKALRKAARDLKSMNARGHKATTAHRIILKQVHSHHNPAILRMLAKGDIHASPCLQSMSGDYVILMDGQVLSYVPALEITSILSDSSGVVNGTENTNSPVPAREKAPVSKEIGCYSHEVVLSTTTEETQNHQSASNEVLAKQDIHTSPCLQSTNHVSTPQSGDCMMLMDGQQLLSFLQAHALEITSILSDSSGVGNGTENTNSPVPAREKASVATEIGCYSHEVLLSTTTEETQNHQSASNEQNANRMKVKNYDLQREGDLIDMKTDGPRIAAAYSLKEINLEQNANRMKVKNYDLQREGGLIDMKTDGPRIAAAYSLKEINLEQNIDQIKIENSVDNLNKEDFIHIKSEEICTPSAFSVNEIKPEISTDVVEVGPALYNERCLASSCDRYEATGTKVEQISDIEDDDEPVLVVYSSVKAECKQNANEMKVEKYDLQREGDLIDVKTDGPCIASAFSVNEINLEQNIDEIKIEDSVDILNKEDSIHIKSDNIYTPPTYSVDENELQVSLGFMIFLSHWFLNVAVFLFNTRDFKCDLEFRECSQLFNLYEQTIMSVRWL